MGLDSTLFVLEASKTFQHMPKQTFLIHTSLTPHLTMHQKDHSVVTLVAWVVPWAWPASPVSWPHT